MRYVLLEDIMPLVGYRITGLHAACRMPWGADTTSCRAQTKLAPGPPARPPRPKSVSRLAPKRAPAPKPTPLVPSNNPQPARTPSPPPSPVESDGDAGFAGPSFFLTDFEAQGKAAGGRSPGAVDDMRRRPASGGGALCARAKPTSENCENCKPSRLGPGGGITASLGKRR